MDERGKELRAKWFELEGHLNSLQNGGNAKIFFLACREANALFQVAMDDLNSPHVLTNQQQSCLILSRLHGNVSRILADNEHFLGGGPDSYRGEYAAFRSNATAIFDELPTINYRLQRLGELLDGHLVGSEPMSHSEMVDFMETLNPLLRAEWDNESDDPEMVTDPPGGFGEKGPYQPSEDLPVSGVSVPGPYYQPARPLEKVDTINGKEILWEPADDEPQVTNNEIDTPIEPESAD